MSTSLRIAYIHHTVNYFIKIKPFSRSGTFMTLRCYLLRDLYHSYRGACISEQTKGNFCEKTTMFKTFYQVLCACYYCNFAQETKKNKELNINDNKNVAVVINCLKHKDLGYDCCRRFINGQVGQKWSEYQPLIKIWNSSWSLKNNCSNIGMYA